MKKTAIQISGERASQEHETSAGVPRWEHTWCTWKRRDDATMAGMEKRTVGPEVRELTKGEGRGQMYKLTCESP